MEILNGIETNEDNPSDNITVSVFPVNMFVSELLLVG